jgi:pyruvate dehydrogenase E1 component
VSPGVYARAYLEGRLSEEQLLNFRQEVDGKGLSSYPHPKLMPNFWQFPTVSMGLGPLMAIYQARFLKYLHARGIANTENRKVWVFCGDGEMDEVESLGAIGLAAREKLDNLVFVINCNLQRLDGPVRGNSKIIQELEGEFRGAGWNVIKLIWGSGWDPLLARDTEGALRKIMMECNDGDYQSFKANDGAYVRKHFFGRDPRTLEMVSKMSDDESLCRIPFSGEPHRPAQRALDQDRQGFWHGQDWRGQEQCPPDQETGRRGHQGLSRPFQHSDPRQPAGRTAVLQTGRRHP